MTTRLRKYGDYRYGNETDLRALVNPAEAPTKCRRNVGAEWHPAAYFWRRLQVVSFGAFSSTSKSLTMSTNSPP